MSWSMFAINYLKLGEAKKAESFYKRNFGYIKNEFQVGLLLNLLFGKHDSFVFCLHCNKMFGSGRSSNLE